MEEDWLSSVLAVKRDCVYEYVKNAQGRIQVHNVMAFCGLSREEATRMLQELKSKGYVGGNARDGYWYSREALDKPEPW